MDSQVGGQPSQWPTRSIFVDEVSDRQGKENPTDMRNFDMDFSNPTTNEGEFFKGQIDTN